MTDEIEKGLQALREMTKAIDRLTENMQNAGDLFLKITDTQIQMLEAELDRQIRSSKLNPEAFFLHEELQRKLV